MISLNKASYKKSIKNLTHAMHEVINKDKVYIMPQDLTYFVSRRLRIMNKK